MNYSWFEKCACSYIYMYIYIYIYFFGGGPFQRSTHQLTSGWQRMKQGEQTWKIAHNVETTIKIVPYAILQEDSNS